MNTSMKILATTVLLLLTFSFVANAQRDKKPKDPEKKAAKKTARMVEDLNLDDQQAARVQEINLVTAIKMHQAKEENKDNRDAMKEIKGAIHEEESKALRAVLTPAQFKVHEEKVAERHSHGGKKGNKGGRKTKK